MLHNLINPNKAKRIPDEWLLNDGQNQVSLSEWISDNADLSNWIDFPVGSVDGTPKLLQVSDAPVLAHVQKIGAEDLYLKMQKNGEWPALVAAYPNILSRDWVRIPLSGDTIVGVNNGWPQLIEPIVKKLKEHDVEFGG